MSQASREHVRDKSNTIPKHDQGMPKTCDRPIQTKSNTCAKYVQHVVSQTRAIYVRVMSNKIQHMSMIRSGC